MTHGVPCNEATFGTWQQAVRKSSSDTPSIQVDNLTVLPAWENHTPAKGIAALVVDQTNVEQQLQRIAESGQVATEVSAGSVTDAQLLDGGGIVQSTLLQIPCPFRIALQLQLVESNRLLQQLGNRRGRQFLLKVRDTLAEWQVQEKLDEADQIAAAPTSVTVEQILAGIDIEGRAAFPM